MDTSELNWSEQIWKEINADVLKEVGKVHVAQKVFPTSTLENDPASIPNEVIDFTNMTVAESATKGLAEIYREFSLTSSQVKNEGEQKVRRMLARMAAKEIALGEDAYFFQVSDRAAKRGQRGVVPVLNNAAIHADNWQPNLNFGHLGFLLGSWLDEVYDWSRRYALNTLTASQRNAVPAWEPAGAKRQPEPTAAAPVRSTS